MRDSILEIYNYFSERYGSIGARAVIELDALLSDGLVDYLDNDYEILSQFFGEFLEEVELMKRGIFKDLLVE